MKEYIVVLKSDPFKHWYSVDAPSKRVARWCAFNMFQNEYCGRVTVKDFKAYPSNWKTAKTLEEVGV